MAIELPNNIRSARKLEGLTLKQLAEKVGASESTISQYELGKRQPDNEMLLKLSKALDTSVGALLGEQKKPASTGDELIEILEAAKERSDLRALFMLAKDTPPDDIKKTISILKALKDD